MVIPGMVTFTGVVFGNTVVFFGEQLLHIYSDSDVVVAEGLIRLVCVCAPYALCGIMEVLVGVLRGMNCAILPVIVSLLGACGLRLLWIATVFQKYRSPRTLYLSYPISWFVTICVHVICLLVVRHHIKKRLRAV